LDIFYPISFTRTNKKYLIKNLAFIHEKEDPNLLPSSFGEGVALPNLLATKELRS